MLDIKFIRENPDKVKENMKKKFREDIHLVDDILNKDKDYRKLLQENEKLRKERNDITKNINETRKSGGDIQSLLSKAKEIPQRLKEIDDQTKKLKEEVIEIQKIIPNMIHESVPIGKNDKENVEVEKVGEPNVPDFEVKNHAEVAEKLGVADFEGAARIAGNGFYFLKGPLAQLNMALVNFARDYMIKQGYQYIEPPLMLREEILSGVYSHKEIEEMSYKIEGEDLYLIATSEHPLIGWFINQRIDEKDLPLKLTGYSMCFRKEIGSHGIDEKGLYRTHQFNKQEMVVICKPEASYKYYEEMLNHSKEVFKQLGLPIRVLECCSGDLADLKAKSVDLEAWSPRKKEYFEITSVSNLTDAQSRRLNIKVDNGETRYLPHTLNNTVIATSRALVAILENYQNADGSITIPKVLQPYMAGKEKINLK